MYPDIFENGVFFPPYTRPPVARVQIVLASLHNDGNTIAALTEHA